jgi:hypothetical protein
MTISWAWHLPRSSSHTYTSRSRPMSQHVQQHRSASLLTAAAAAALSLVFCLHCHHAINTRTQQLTLILSHNNTIYQCCCCCCWYIALDPPTYLYYHSGLLLLCDINTHTDAFSLSLCCCCCQQIYPFLLLIHACVLACSALHRKPRQVLQNLPHQLVRKHGNNR